jgi:hypothetical protein
LGRAIYDRMGGDNVHPELILHITSKLNGDGGSLNVDLQRGLQQLPRPLLKEI